MDVGVQIPATAETGDMVTLGRLAEDLGFESYFIGEHVTVPSGFRSVAPGSHQGVLPEHYGRWMDPFVVLAAVAGATSRIKLGTGVCLPVQRNVLVLAKEIATLDVLSGGRLVVGVGAGWIREECEAAGIPFGQRWTRLRESVEAMRILWREAEASYEGEMVSFPPLRCEPKPVQAGGPPILLGAGGAALGGNPRVIERVARTYDGWFPVAGDPAIMGAEIATLRRLAQQVRAGLLHHGYGDVRGAFRAGDRRPPQAVAGRRCFQDRPAREIGRDRYGRRAGAGGGDHEKAVRHLRAGGQHQLSRVPASL